MLGDAREVGVRRQKLQLVTDAELSDDRVDRADLYAAPAGAISNGREAKRATIASWARGPLKPWRSS